MKEPTKPDVQQALRDTAKLCTDLYDQIDGEGLDVDEAILLRSASVTHRMEAIHKAMLVNFIASGRASPEFRRRVARELRR